MKFRHSLISLIVIFTMGSFFNICAQQQPSLQMQTAMELVKEQKWADAIAVLESVTNSEPNNGRAWFLLGTSYHKIGNYQKAVTAYEKNIPISKNPTAMYNLACAYSRLDKKDKAFEWLEKSITAGVAPTVNIENDEDFAGLKTNERFKQLIELAERKTKPCKFIPESHQFDFWLGEWDVFPSQAPLGQAPKVGDSKIESISEGCGLLENWTSTGNNGKSINYYDANTKKWYQYWIGSNGGPLRFEGNFTDGAIRFEDVSIGTNGKKVINKLTFFKIDENTVRQLGEVSNDEGKTWTTSYDFKYVRKK